MIFLSTLLVSILTTIILVPLFGRLAVKMHALDMPDARKVHSIPIPRCGGIAMAIGAFLPVIYWESGELSVRAWLASAGILALFGIFDDFCGLGYKTKLFGQIVAALIVIVFGGVTVHSLGALLPDGYQLPGWAAVFLTLIAIVGVTNAINLADGLDGLAGGISLLIFGCIGYLAYLCGSTVIGLIALSMIGVIFGFLRYNTFPASVFMGDTGSQFLGFSAGTLSIALTQENPALSPVLPLILLGFPVLDTLTVLCTRLAQGRSPFVADKNHFHHNLMNFGLYHPESVLIIYIIQSFLIVAAYYFRHHSDWLLLTCYLFFSAFILAAFACGSRTDRRLGRSGLWDVAVKKICRRLRERGTVIRVTFKGFAAGVPLLLFAASLLPRHVPFAFVGITLTAAVVLGGTWLLRRKALGAVLIFVLYLTIPLMVFLSETYPPVWMNELVGRIYTVSFGLFGVCILVIAKFSRRKEGFKSTPLDFLILFIVLMLIKVQGEQLQDLKLGVIAAKIVIFYFCYEVLLAEQRHNYTRVALITFVTLIVFSLKNLFL